MDRQTKEILQQVWSSRNEIIPPWDQDDDNIYNYESDISRREGFAHLLDVVRYGTKLEWLKEWEGREFEEGDAVRFYKNLRMGFEELGANQAWLQFDGIANKRFTVDISPGFLLVKEKGPSQPFKVNYHFPLGRIIVMRSSGDRFDGALGRYTIYLNAKPEQRAIVFTIATKLVRNGRDYYASEIATPGNQCAGAVALRFTSKAGMEEGVSRITKWAQVYGGNFRFRVKPLTTAVKNLNGISTAIDVPKPAVNEDAANQVADERYGNYRAKIIYAALERTIAPKAHTKKNRWFNKCSYSKFEDRVKRYFGAAGINRHKPGNHKSGGQSGYRMSIRDVVAKAGGNHFNALAMANVAQQDRNSHRRGGIGFCSGR